MKNRTIYLIIMLLFFVGSAFGTETEIIGTWTGAIDLPGMKLDISVSLDINEAGDLSGTIDIPQQQAIGLKLTDFSLDGQSIIFAIDGIPEYPVFKGELEDNIISGIFEQGGQSFPFSLERATDLPETVKLTEEEFFEKIRDIAAKSMDSWNIPGMAIGIVKDGELVFAEAFGYRNLEEELPATINTQFAIGSTTKAISALGLAILEEDGLIDWNEPVISYLPDFRLYDEVATARLNSLDLLTHRSGLPRHDFFWYGSNRSREELYYAMRYLENSRDIRTHFQYQNVMYMVTGVLIEKITGKTWEEFIAERIFGPLGMNNSSLSLNGMQKVDDFSYPYMYLDDEIKRIPFRNIDAIGPAGSVNSSVKDMSQWLNFLLSKGKADDTQIVETTTIDFLFLPQISIAGDYGHSQYTGYSPGWLIEFSKGKRHFHHGGGIDGFISHVGLLPDAKVGYVVLTNNAGNAAGSMIGNYILDFYYDFDPVEWTMQLLPSNELNEETDSMVEIPEDPEPEELRVEGTSPSLPLEDYVGTYSNRGYGRMEIKYDNGKLIAQYNSYEMPMKHWHFDVFKSEYLFGADITIQFEMDIHGNISGLKVPFEISVSPIAFDKEIDESLTSREYLEKFTGKYAIGPQISSFRIARDRLRLSITGQPPYMLEAIRENEFSIEGLDGFRVRFEFENGEKASKVFFHQPNGVFEAIRKE